MMKSAGEKDKPKGRGKSRKNDNDDDDYGDGRCLNKVNERFDVRHNTSGPKQSIKQ